jgi:CheY-like chemotaxis protein
VVNPGLVVVVTEEPLVRKVLTDTLEGEGWVVLALDDGAELLDFVEFVSAHPGRRIVPRLVVADAAAPGPSVFETADWARRNGVEVPFVLFTGADDPKSRDLARALGAVEVVHDALAA